MLGISYTFFSQGSIKGKVLSQNTKTPVPFGTIKINNTYYGLTSYKGEFELKNIKPPFLLTLSHLGHSTKNIEVKNFEPILLRLNIDEQNLGTLALDNNTNEASKIIKQTILTKKSNDPFSSENQIQFKSYTKLKITEDNTAKLHSSDTTNLEMEHLFNEAHSFLSEKISIHHYNKVVGEKETVLASKMTGFKQPMYSILGIKIQSTSIYDEDYTIFDNKYIAPLSKKALKNYYYKVLDTTKGKNPAFIVLFQPRKSKKTAQLEGTLYIDQNTFAIQKAVIELKGELNVTATHHFNFLDEIKMWFPKSNEINIRAGNGSQKVSFFGSNISVGQLSNKKDNVSNNDFFVSKTDFFDIKLNGKNENHASKAKINIHPEAANRDEQYWQYYRTNAITKKDLNSFPTIDSIVKVQKIERKIDVKQSFSRGYYPIGFIDLDLTYPIKFNNYEGFRTGLGARTNSKFSKRIGLEGYSVYGFNDQAWKYSLGLGLLIHKNSNSWLNFKYTDDVQEVGSLFYLTDRKTYSLFEPRLVNIDFYYKYKSWNIDLQHQISPNLDVALQLSTNQIEQTTEYLYSTNNNIFSNYKITTSSIALHWCPFSEFLKTPHGFKEIYAGYPKITAQYTRAYKNVLESDFSFDKIGLKAEYNITRINNTKTSILFEADIAFGSVPLTHLYHAYPNAPDKETVLQRFSVAGRRTFETMYFGEFFSDRLATLQLKHRTPPLRITNWLKPEVVLISRYAIGDISAIDDHQNVNFSSLENLYQESGLEINKLFAGFGLSFAYRYGAYHLPEIDDNFAFKFTFYLEL